MERLLLAALMGLVLVAGIAYALKGTNFSSALPNLQPNERTVRVGGTPFHATIAETPSQWTTGLSDSTTSHTMLFVFDRDDDWGIWMKDMHYSIDVLWIDSTKHVIHIEHELLPSSYPHVYRAAEPSRYVLEMPGGYANLYGLRVGDTVGW